MDKEALRRAIIERLEADLAVLVSAANSAKDEATDAESKSEGKYDMRGQTAAYLAAGQAKLATELGEAVSAYRLMVLPAGGGAVAMGSVVVLEAQGRRTSYFIGPARGGLELDAGGESVTVITASSPLGRQLLGRRAGESVALAGVNRRQVVAEVG